MQINKSHIEIYDGPEHTDSVWRIVKTARITDGSGKKREVKFILWNGVEHVLHIRKGQAAIIVK